MKKINLFALVTAIVVLFSSCSNNESILEEQELSTDLLKTYKITKDAEGNYSLDFNVNDGTKVESVLDTETNTKNFYLYSSDTENTRRVTKDLVIEGEQLTVGFVDTSSDKLPSVTIIDDNISFAKTEETEKLKEYSIESIEDGTFVLDFAVNNNVVVDFIYNDEIATYEIHLKEGKSEGKEFSRVLEKEEGKMLKLDFVNYIESVAGKNMVASKTTEKKPRLSFQ